MEIGYLVPLLAAVIYISVCFVVAVNGTQQREHKLFILYLAAATLWSFSDFILRSNLFEPHKIILFRLVIWSSLLWTVQFYAFVRAFLKLPTGWGVPFGYVSLVVLGIAAALGLVPNGITFVNGVIETDYGKWFILYLGPMIVIGSLGAYSLIQRIRIVTDSSERNKVAYIMTAIGMLVVFGFLGVTPLARAFPVSHIGGLFSASILAYAIIKHDLVSINSVLRQVLGWASLALLGIGTYIFFLYLLHFILKFELVPVTLAAATIVSFCTSIFVYKMRQVFFGMVDQLFYRETYWYRQSLLGFNIKMGNIINLSELANEMLPTIVKALRTSQAHLLFEDSSTGDFVAQFSYPQPKEIRDDLPKLPRDSPIIAWLGKDASYLDVKQIEYIPQLKALWQSEKENLKMLDMEFICPIKSRGKLIGILVLGKKQSKSVYSQEDLETIISLANQAAIIIENARMFDILKKQQQQVQQILAQAVLAQEEERQRISIDLHDSVAQWLAGASYHVQTAEALLSRDTNEVRDELSTVESTIDRSLKELRRVVIGLRPPALDELGLEHALRQSLEELKSDGLICKFSEIGTQARLSSSVEIAVYRLVQEALTNIRKHAQATKVNLRLQFRKDNLQVEIRDNGKGFNLSQTLDSAVSVGHMGLLGMKQRAEMLGGDIKIKTGEGSGTVLTLNLPIELHEEEVA
jgi:signal transduction histidine kinase